MTLTASDPKTLFQERMPVSLEQEVLLRILREWDNTRAYVLGADFQPRIAHELFPHELRARVDNALLGLAPNVPFIATTVEPNKRKTSYHTLISFPRVMITASAVRAPRAKVRNAGFRNKYARLQSKFVLDEKNNELHLDKTVAPEDAIIYAIIIHGPELQGDRYANGFVDLVFLDHDGNQLDQRIRLKEKYPEVVASVYGVEQVPDKAQPEPIRTRKQV